MFGVSPLLQALIVEAAGIEGQEDGDGYAGRVTGLILDQLRRARPLPGALPWPRGEALAALCEALYADPADRRGPGAWGRALGMSERTLARRFEAEVGMSLRSWRRRLRLFKAIELLGGGLGVTRAAMPNTSLPRRSSRSTTSKSPLVTQNRSPRELNEPSPMK